MKGIDPDLLEEFVAETKETLAYAESDLLTLEAAKDGETDPEGLNRIFRAFHSIKGGSGFFDLAKIGMLSHRMEDVLSRLRDGQTQLLPEIIDTLLDAIDLLKKMIDDPVESNSIDISEIMSRLENLDLSMDAVSAEENKPAKNESGSEEKDVDEAPETPTHPGKSESGLQSPGNDYVIPREKVIDLARYGMKIYRIRISPEKHIKSNWSSVEAFLDNITSLGEILHTEPELSNDGDSNENLNEKTFLEIIIATILDSELVPAGFGIPSECIHEIPIILESETTSTGPSESQADDTTVTGLRENTKPVAGSGSGPRKTGIPSTSRTEKISGTSQSQRSPLKPIHKHTEETVRVKTSILNSLMEMAGELVLGRNRLIHLLENNLEHVVGLDSALGRLKAITSSIQEEIMKTRLQPISTLFSRYPRIVRNLNTQLGKEAVLHTEGIGVELDRAIIEMLSDPLVHLVRNAVDHGIETPEEREKAGKPRQGNISMKAYNEAGVVVIDVEDDGAGIERDWIISRALSKRIVTEEELDKLTEDQILSLVMRPGFSTASTVTTVSGRGVGLDIVKTNIERLGGDVELKSIPGKGTIISLKLPLTLAILPSLIIEDGGYLFAVPQSSVEEVLRITGEELMRKINKINNTMVLKHRKGLLPLIDFSDFLGLSSSGQDDIHRILILKTGRQKFGIMIDNILDNEEIVVKPLSKYLRSSPCYSGASILGNGKIAPILDPVGIVQMSKLEKLEAFNETETETRNKFIREDARETMLIFESGGKELFALPFFQIARIVKITPEKIEKLKDTHYLKHGDETMLLIDSGMFTGMNRTWMAGSGEPVLAVVPRGEGSRIALAVSRIFNTTFSGDELDTGEQPEKFILGKIISENRIATVLDLDEIIRSVLDEEDAFHLSSGEIRKRFLLIDTSPFLGTAQKIQLEKTGFTVITARDVDEGWQLIRKKLFDAILIDADISDSEVCAITDRMKREKDLMEIPVIILQSTIQTPTTRDCFSEKSLETAVKLNMKEITAVLRKYETAAAGSV